MGRRNSASEAGTDQENVGTFETLRDEGEHFVHVAQYRKAIDSFTSALNMREDDKHCLVARSKCHLQVGDANKSLVDAEAALVQDPEYIRGKFQKAEALYQLGDFETALVYYHRGQTARPELQEFRLGIQKAQEAINNSIGTPESVNLTSDHVDLTQFYAKQDKGPGPGQHGGGGGGGGYTKPQRKEEVKAERKRPKSTADSKTMRQLLGELYGDKKYLEKILNDEATTGQNNQTSKDIKSLVLDGLEYLESRTEFWRQQKPLYARKRDKKRQQEQFQRKQTVDSAKTEPTRFVLKKLDEIDNAQALNKHEQSLKLATKTLNTVENWTNNEVPNKAEVVCNLHSLIGNAHLEMECYDKALQHHQQDLDIAEENDLVDAKSRALDNLGRVHARKKDYNKAISIWESKLSLSKTAMESTWLYHEIGRCYLELSQWQQSREYGEKSLAAAKDANDNDWQLHSSVLIAQSEVKLGDLQASVDSFEHALDLSKTLKDESAERAIKKALEEVNDMIVKGIKEDDEDQDQSDLPEETKGDDRKMASPETMAEVETRSSPNVEGDQSPGRVSPEKPAPTQDNTAEDTTADNASESDQARQDSPKPEKTTPDDESPAENPEATQKDEDEE